MRKDFYGDLSAYRISRSKETFEEALIMQREEHWNACMNRLYYAAFYAVSALLIRHDMSSGKHTGVKSLFNQHFVKTGKISKDDGRLYNFLFESRQEGDYMDFAVFDRNTVEPKIEQVRNFLSGIYDLVWDEQATLFES